LHVASASQLTPQMALVHADPMGQSALVAQPHVLFGRHAGVAGSPVQSMHAPGGPQFVGVPAHGAAASASGAASAASAPDAASLASVPDDASLASAPEAASPASTAAVPSASALASFELESLLFDPSLFDVPSLPGGESVGPSAPPSTVVSPRTSRPVSAPPPSPLIEPSYAVPPQAPSHATTMPVPSAIPSRDARKRIHTSYAGALPDARNRRYRTFVRTVWSTRHASSTVRRMAAMPAAMRSSEAA
jgi:hypothetical protein